MPINLDATLSSKYEPAIFRWDLTAGTVGTGPCLHHANLYAVGTSTGMNFQHDSAESPTSTTATPLAKENYREKRRRNRSTDDDVR